MTTGLVTQLALLSHSISPAVATGLKAVGIEAGKALIANLLSRIGNESDTEGLRDIAQAGQRVAPVLEQRALGNIPSSDPILQRLERARNRSLQSTAANLGVSSTSRAGTEILGRRSAEFDRILGEVLTGLSTQSAQTLLGTGASASAGLATLEQQQASAFAQQVAGILDRLDPRESRQQRIAANLLAELEGLVTGARGTDVPQAPATNRATGGATPRTPGNFIDIRPQR